MSETTWRLAPAEATEEMAVRAFQTVDLALAAVEMAPCDQYRYAYRASLSAAPKPPAGLYEVREDGTARRVEVDAEMVERVGKPIAYALCKAFGIDPEAPAKPHGEWPNWLEAMGNGGAEAARAALRALTGEER